MAREDIGSRWRQAREAMGISQTLLAESAGVSERTVRRAERGETISTESARCMRAVLEMAETEGTPTANPSPAPVPLYPMKVSLPRWIVLELGCLIYEDAWQSAVVLMHASILLITVGNFIDSFVLAQSNPALAIVAGINSCVGIPLAYAYARPSRTMHEVGLAFRGASPLLMFMLNWQALYYFAPSFHVIDDTPRTALDVLPVLYGASSFLAFLYPALVDLAGGFWRMVSMRLPSWRIHPMDCRFWTDPCWPSR